MVKLCKHCTQAPTKSPTDAPTDAPAVVECACQSSNEEEIQPPEFMQVESSPPVWQKGGYVYEGTNWIGSYMINTAQDSSSSPIPHPGRIIKMAIFTSGEMAISSRRLETRGYENVLRDSFFSDTSKYSVVKYGAVEYSASNIPDDIDIIWDLLPDRDRSAAEVAIAQALLDRGGRIFAMGDYQVRNGAAYCKRISNLVANLGGGVQMPPSGRYGNRQRTFAQHEVNKLQATGGVAEIATGRYGWSNLQVDMSVSEVIATGSRGEIFMADQQLSNGRLTVWATLQVFGTYKRFGDYKFTASQNAVLLQNLVHQGANFVEAVEQGQRPNAGGLCQC